MNGKHMVPVAAWGKGRAIAPLSADNRPGLRKPFFRLAACGRVWLSLAMLLALLWQALVIQAHVHVAPSATALANAQAAVTGPTPKDGDDPATCPICREMAHAGHYLAATPPFIRRPLARSLPWRSVLLRRWLTRKRSHAWKSREPPARAA